MATKPAKRARNYAREYELYHKKPEQIANRAARNKARAMMKKKVGASALKGKDVDHKRPLIKGGSNAMSNLQVTSVAYNRGVKKRKTKNK